MLAFTYKDGKLVICIPKADVIDDMFKVRRDDKYRVVQIAPSASPHSDENVQKIQ